MPDEGGTNGFRRARLHQQESGFRFLAAHRHRRLFFNRINRLTPRMAYLPATLTLMVIGAADYLTGVELMLSPFYAIPCLLMDWRIGRVPASLWPPR
jgi:hypothetical protein